MKITKSKLKQIIKEELEAARELREAHPRVPEPREFHGEISRAYDPYYDDPDISRRREAPEFRPKIPSFQYRHGTWMEDLEQLADLAIEDPWGNEGEPALYRLKNIAHSGASHEAEYASALLDAIKEAHPNSAF